MAFELPPLPYDHAALEPVIDKQTMTLHHDMHHGAYVKNLNAAIEKHPELGKKSAEDLIRDLNSIPDDIRRAVRNNGGGHVNHSMFWQIMKPKAGGQPSGTKPARPANRPKRQPWRTANETVWGRTHSSVQRAKRADPTTTAETRSPAPFKRRALLS